MTSDPSDDPLKRRYLDWCSTQVARRFLELSLDDVWLRSHLAASLPPSSDDPQSDIASFLLSADRIPGYLDLVRKTTLLLAQEMDLPDFDEWKQEYLRNPDGYEDDIMAS